MKTLKIFMLLAGAAAVLTGCETYDGRPDRTASGALIGGAAGATAGAIIGNNTHGHHSGTGALIGGAIGVLTGGLIGHSLDEQERARLQAEAPQTYYRVEQGQPLTIGDVKALARANVGDDLIISQMRSTRTVYRLSAADIIDLRDAGVSERVIEFMINSSATSAAPVAPTQVYVAQAPPSPPYETIVVAPAPGYVWCGGEWVWNGRWAWRSGYWAPPPRHSAIWVSGVWIHGSRGWHHRPGYWR